ncbi:HesA/MoeB/ThiF family protein [Streptomyces zaomyceticus]|uniref:HesA/MoeB/ThiF family protein n=1 Tax=Streptomyces zaomyceticus TaxID=68286 RepID=UPI0037ACD4F9
MLILVPHRAAATMRQAGPWGLMTLRGNHEDLAVIRGISASDGVILPVDAAPGPTLIVASGDVSRSGCWYRVAPELHLYWRQLSGRLGTGIPLSVFQEHLTSGYKNPGGNPYIALTYAPDAKESFPEHEVSDIVAWHIGRDGAYPLASLVEPPITGIGQLQDHWPVRDLQSTRVMLVGTGSIGSAAAHALAGYGIGHLTLVDPDRLTWHNLVRHTTGRRHVGRPKATALAEELASLRPDTTIVPLVLDVIDDADQIRPLLQESDLVVCTADGVAARRVTGHLARRAGIPAVMACVLQDGALGEILRLRPWPQHGCLTCRRQTLAERGGIDPEPALDAGYGTGTRHRPMTAVGPDLHLVAHLAAKTAVATLLERHGHPDQRLPGEHGLISLRRQPDCAPPFDLSRTGETRWLPATPPHPGCPTCETP